MFELLTTFESWLIWQIFGNMNIRTAFFFELL